MESKGTNTNRKSTTTKTTTTKKTTTKATTQRVEKAPEPKAKRLRVADVDLNELVEVQNCTSGELIYKNREGFMVTWTEFGDVQWLTAGELLTMRKQHPAFFRKQWVNIIGDNAAEMMNFLQIEQYYAEITNIDDIDDIFGYDADEFRFIIEKFNDTLKESIARRGYQLVQDGKLSDLKIIEVVKEVTGYDISEKE